MEKIVCGGILLMILSKLAVFSAVSGLELSMSHEHHRCKNLCLFISPFYVRINQEWFWQNHN